MIISYPCIERDGEQPPSSSSIDGWDANSRGPSLHAALEVAASHSGRASPFHAPPLLGRLLDAAVTEGALRSSFTMEPSSPTKMAQGGSPRSPGRQPQPQRRQSLESEKWSPYSPILLNQLIREKETHKTSSSPPWPPVSSDPPHRLPEIPPTIVAAAAAVAVAQAEAQAEAAPQPHYVAPLLEPRTTTASISETLFPRPQQYASPPGHPLAADSRPQTATQGTSTATSGPTRNRHQILLAASDIQGPFKRKDASPVFKPVSRVLFSTPVGESLRPTTAAFLHPHPQPRAAMGGSIVRTPYGEPETASAPVSPTLPGRLRLVDGHRDKGEGTSALETASLRMSDIFEPSGGCPAEVPRPTPVPQLGRGSKLTSARGRRFGYGPILAVTQALHDLPQDLTSGKKERAVQRASTTTTLRSSMQLNKQHHRAAAVASHPHDDLFDGSSVGRATSKASPTHRDQRDVPSGAHGSLPVSFLMGSNFSSSGMMRSELFSAKSPSASPTSPKPAAVTPQR